MLTPAIARPDPDGGYEIISGHRRMRACELAGIKTLPVIVRDMDDDTAIIFMVDANLQREHILPSERAFAYRMKLEAMKHQAGRPSKENYSQVGNNSGKTSSQERSYTPQQMQDVIVKLLDQWQKKRNRDQSRYAAYMKYRHYRSERKTVKEQKKAQKAKEKSEIHGKQSVKDLVGQNQGVSNMEIAKTDLKGFERVTRKYGVDYAIRKDPSQDPPRYIVFFKARDADALTAAFITKELLSILGHQKDYHCLIDYGSKAIRLEPGLQDAYYWVIIAAENIGNSATRERCLATARQELTDEEYEKLTHMLNASKVVDTAILAGQSQG